MLSIYLIAIAAGAALLIGSLVARARDEGRRPLSARDFSAWLPMGSPHYWIYFLAFGGAIGAILTRQGVAAPPVIAAIAIVIGWLAGVVAVAVVRALRGTGVDTTVGEPGLIGAHGTVTTAVPEGGTGMVRLKSRGQNLDLVAEGEYSAAIPSGIAVTVVGRGEDGRVLVSRGETDRA